MELSQYSLVKSKLKEQGLLYEDNEFAANASSLYYSRDVGSAIRWRRPRELCDNPQFIVEGVSRHDLDQGQLGNCWFVAAAATLATKRELFNKVVPVDQSFAEDDYAGIFRFNFWRFGKWVEVVIDDRLPVISGKLVFCSNRENPDEFWGPLLEKAYAKLNGSYEAMDGGLSIDALVDLTGGVSQVITLNSDGSEKTPRKLFKMLMKMQKRNTLMCSSIHGSKIGSTRETKLPNGLYSGHAYSLTKVVKKSVKSKTVRLIRLRNPWGKKEWTGPWSDRSKEWKDLSEKDRNEMEQEVREDGEFWMTYEDWKSNFTDLQMCHLSPDSAIYHDRIPWNLRAYHSAWVEGATAGGCGNPPHEESFWMNPQFFVTLREEDPDDDEHTGTVIIAVMQKYRRLLKTILHTQENTNKIIGFQLYQLKTGEAVPLDGRNVKENALEFEKLVDYCSNREVCAQYHLQPGTYVVIPSTFDPKESADFLLRIITVNSVDAGELDEVTSPIEGSSRLTLCLKNELEHSQPICYSEVPQSDDEYIRLIFNKYCGADGLIDARELRHILNDVFRDDLQEDQRFSTESCRSLITKMDTDRSGYLDFAETRKMWEELKVWREVFKKCDMNNSGYIETKELRKAIKSIGFRVNKTVLASIVLRYGGRNKSLTFDDFVICAAKLVVMYNTFTKFKESGSGNVAKLTLNEWMRTTMYF